MSNYDAIVIGAGHNGLTNAAYLAKSGLKVMVLEKNDYIGGAAVSRELHDGWTYSNCSYVCSLLRPEIYRDLNLQKHGLQVLAYGGSVTFMKNGDIFGGYSDHDVARREIGRFSKKDADAYERFSRDVSRQCRFIKPLLLRTPPDPTSFKPKDLSELLFLFKRLYGLGEETIYDTIRFYTMSVAEYLEEYFESDVVKAALSGSGIIGTGLGPYSPGTAYVLLHHYMGEVDGNIGSWGFARGGMGAVSNALAGALKEHSGEIKTNSEVSQIIVKNGRATGVVLANGDEHYAKNIVSNLDVKRTYQKLFDQIIQSNLLYETNSGNLPQQEYTYVEVEPGMGNYKWIDINGNNIQELEEFELAQFQDEGLYIRVFLPNQIYLKTSRILPPALAEPQPGTI